MSASSSFAAFGQGSNDTATTPLSVEQLKTFLVEAPAMYNYRLHPGAERQILTNCYRMLWGNNTEWMQKYFFKEGLSDQDNLSALLEKYNLFKREDQQKSTVPANPDNVVVDPTDDEPEYWESQRGKQCGHLFKRGESVYRCRNCGLDDTCVLCSRCFHATNHEGHDVKIWISRGSGGCCDCGDPEAWKVPLVCDIHSLSAARSISESGESLQPLEPTSSIPPALISQIKNTISTVMDYVLETFAASPENIKFGDPDDIRQDAQATDRALRMPNGGNNDQELYACILWNDETHTFDKVIEVVKRAIKCTTSQASAAAETVDAYGRYIVATSSDLDELVQIGRIISSIKLAVTIRSCKDTVREEICGLLLDWLKELTSGRYTFFSNVEKGNCIIRDIICEVLCEEWSLRPDLAALSIRTRRGPMSDVDDLGDLDDFGDEGPDLDEDNDGNDDDDMMAAAHMIELDDELITQVFEAANDEDIWMDVQGEDEDDDDDDDDDDSSQDDDNHDDNAYEESDGDVEMHGAEDLEDQHERPTQRTNIANSPHRHSSPSQPTHTSSANQDQSSSSQHQRRHSQQYTHDIIDLSNGFNEWLRYTEKLDADEAAIAQELGIPVINNSDSAAAANKHVKKEFNRKLRLDYLMQYDLRLWKSARASIKDLLIGTVVSNYDYRPIIGIRFARNYPELLDAFFLKDREPEHSVGTLSVQLLTVPTVAALLVREYKFFAMVCSILANFFLTDRIHLVLPEQYHHLQVNCGSRAIRRPRFAVTFYDLRYVLNTDLVKPDICQSPLYLRHFLDLLYQFQAMDPLVRSGSVHVEYESTTWVGAFNATLQVSKLCQLFSDCFAPLSTSTPSLEGTRTLCRSITRVLKAIVDWAPRAAEGNTEHDYEIIKGVREQKYKTVEALHAGTYSIVSYDIAAEPVSFHHPYHWLLSGMLEHVDLLTDEAIAELGWKGNLKGLINHFSEQQHMDHDVFMAIMEYPLRVRALLAQVNCGVWVRNGFGIRNQARTYRDVSVREKTYDCDLYLLQVALTVAEPNLMLLTMLDRFILSDWFNGHPDKSHPYYDQTQIALVVEEFLDYLIIAATERGFASGMPLEDKIRRAIIQYLGLSSMAYSELVKVLPDSLSEHESFETHLHSLSTYKAPAGLNDHGRYELKDEYYCEIDPYFWHFSRNQREEAFEKLRSRENQSLSNNEKKKAEKDEFFLLPRLRKIKSGPFKHIGNFLHSHLLCQIVLYALWNSRTSKATSELILDHALYLAVLAVTDENNEVYEKQRALIKGKYRNDGPKIDGGFVQHAVENKYPIVSGFEREHVSLLTVLLRFLGDREFSHTHKRCNFLVDKIFEQGSDAAREMIADWRATHQKSQDKAAEQEKAGLSEYERKKAEAKARQAEIMAQFAQAQSQFMSQHADLYEDEDDENLQGDNGDEMMTDQPEIIGEDEDVERTCHFPSGTCIVCQEELDRSRLFGVLGLVQKSKSLRNTPMKNADVLVDIFETAQGKGTWSEHMEASPNKKSAYRGFPMDSHVDGLHISTCGHLMHAHCFNGYQESVDSDTINPIRNIVPQLRHKQFLCPLCKALGNVLIPIVWKGKKESYPGPMATKTPYEDLGETAKRLMARLENDIGPPQPIPGGMVEDEDDPRNDPDVDIEDLDGLRRLYNQLRTAMKKGANSIIHEMVSFSELRSSIIDLYNMYVYALTTLEVAQRGDHGVRARDVQVEHTGTFLDDISSQSQMLLKILAKTGELMPTIMNTRWVTDDRFTLQRISLSILRQVFYEENAPGPGDAYERDVLCKPLLADDPFHILVRLSFVTARAGEDKLEPHHILRLLYIAELVKVTIGLLQGLGKDSLSTPRVNETFEQLKQNATGHQASAEAARAFASNVAALVGIPATTVEDFFAVYPPNVFVSLLRTFTMPYLRKSLLLMVVHHGFILQNQSSQDFTGDEYDRLLHILKLPMFPDIFNLQAYEQTLVTGWCRQYSEQSQQGLSVARPLLSLPTPSYLVSLPYRMDKLFDDSARRVCRKCGNLPEYPALCLICGTFVCARRYCCTENGRGECNTHMKKCSGDIGIFLVVKESFILLLHADGGSIMSAPYLDIHGEVDLFLRRGTPQFLNPQRYEQIRQMWLSHSIPAYVRRKMESSYSYTRWGSW